MSAGKEPTTPFRHCAITSSGPETMNIGEPMTGRAREAARCAGRAIDASGQARSRREAIAPLLSFITLNVIGEGADLVVYKGNARLSAGAYGSALPSNPGESVIQVVRGEDLLWDTKVVLDRAQMRTVDVPLGEIAAKNPTTGKKRWAVCNSRLLC